MNVGNGRKETVIDHLKLRQERHLCSRTAVKKSQAPSGAAYLEIIHHRQ